MIIYKNILKGRAKWNIYQKKNKTNNRRKRTK